MRPTRRSFLSRVLGDAPLVGALCLVTGQAYALAPDAQCGSDGDFGDPSGAGLGARGATGLTDADVHDATGHGRRAPAPQPSPPRAENRVHTGVSDQDSTDRNGYGRPQRTAGTTGLTDSDSGDARGNGRGVSANGRSRTGLSDQDAGDSRGYGRGTGPVRSAQGRVRTGFSDQDPTDLSGYGRQQRLPGQTGFTDEDSGDRSGYGNGIRTGSAAYPGTAGITDRDEGRNADPPGRGRGGLRRMP